MHEIAELTRPRWRDLSLRRGVVISCSVDVEASLPQLLMRFGYADALPRSLRRPVDQVLI